MPTLALGMAKAMGVPTHQLQLHNDSSCVARLHIAHCNQSHTAVIDRVVGNLLLNSVCACVQIYQFIAVIRAMLGVQFVQFVQFGLEPHYSTLW